MSNKQETLDYNTHSQSRPRLNIQRAAKPAVARANVADARVAAPAAKPAVARANVADARVAAPAAKPAVARANVADARVAAPAAKPAVARANVADARVAAPVPAPTAPGPHRPCRRGLRKTAAERAAALASAAPAAAPVAPTKTADAVATPVHVVQTIVPKPENQKKTYVVMDNKNILMFTTSNVETTQVIVQSNPQSGEQLANKPHMWNTEQINIVMSSNFGNILFIGFPYRNVQQIPNINLVALNSNARLDSIKPDPHFTLMTTAQLNDDKRRAITLVKKETKFSFGMWVHTKDGNGPDDWALYIFTSSHFVGTMDENMNFYVYNGKVTVTTGTPHVMPDGRHPNKIARESTKAKPTKPAKPSADSVSDLALFPPLNSDSSSAYAPAGAWSQGSALAATPVAARVAKPAATPVAARVAKPAATPVAACVAKPAATPVAARVAKPAATPVKCAAAASRAAAAASRSASFIADVDAAIAVIVNAARAAAAATADAAAAADAATDATRAAAAAADAATDAARAAADVKRRRRQRQQNSRKARKAANRQVNECIAAECPTEEFSNEAGDENHSEEEYNADSRNQDVCDWMDEIDMDIEETKRRREEEDKEEEFNITWL